MKTGDSLVNSQSPEVVVHGGNASSMTESAKGMQYDQFVSLFARHEQAVRGFVRC